GTSALTRQASKTIGEISPAATPVLALQALAKHLDADAILGITADEQTPCARTRSSRNRGTTRSGDEQRGAPGSVLPAARRCRLEGHSAPFQWPSRPGSAQARAQIAHPGPAPGERGTALLRR